MAVRQLSQSTGADAHHAPSISPSSLHPTKQRRRPISRTRRILPSITLPLAILAVAATFSSYVVAGTDALAFELARPASLEKAASFSSVLNDDETVLATAEDSIPAADEQVSVELRIRRRPRAASLLTSSSTGDDNGDIEDDKASTASHVLSERASETSDGGSSPLPSPFDNLVPSAFQVPGGGNSCPKFMASLLSDPTFKRCYPISMLMQTSTGFFDAQKKLVSLVKVLDATCSPDVTKCTDFLNQAARNLTLEANCKNEYEQNQTQVLLAYRGLRAYNVMYSAACLQDPSSSSYCFANAVTNMSTPSNTYLYFMPYGLSLPGASKPTCNWCTKTTMSIYNAAAADRRQPVAAKYEDAAQQVNTLCGPNFVNSSLPVASNTVSSKAPSGLGLFVTILFTLIFVACPL
ncbi:hypothetical protein E4U54_001420 [Claviceps lovelessii]|nr:hypothetical protein E4U54_001420 [Claviceps lovelessii]